MDGFDPVEYIMDPNKQQIRLGLERTIELLDRMGNPQDKLKFVHVAGTNGKGSVCSFVESSLREAGYKTGLFTSPHLVDFSERIQVNGVQIPPADLLDVTLFVKEHADALAAEMGEYPTEFELMTAVGFEFFARCGCDIVVAEVGLGGRLDSTNVIKSPEACVIVRLGIDHTGMLGDTIEQIAREKAGIIKPGSVVVSWPQDDPGAMAVIEQVARDCGDDLIVADLSQLTVKQVRSDGLREFAYKGVDYTTRLLGSYQPSNAALAIEVLEVLGKRGWNIAPDHICEGIARTSWPGRFEVYPSSGERPIIVVDGGHNAQGAEVLAESLRSVFPDRKVVALMSVLGDKDYPAMIATIAPLAQAWVCSCSTNYRALATPDLAQTIKDIAGEGIPVIADDTFAAALEHACALAGPQGIVCAFGSLYSIADIKAAVERE